MKQRYHVGATALLLLTFLFSPPVQAQVTVSGAGSSETNGLYNQGSDLNEKKRFQHSTNPEYEVRWSGSQWRVENTFFSDLYYTNTVDCGTQPPDIGWVVGDFGNPPAPTVSGDVCTLSVELTNFEARSDGEDVQLAWQTSSETNNAGFEVQRAVINEARELRDNWETLGFVEGHGTTGTPRTYSFQAENLPPGRQLFRLKQIDYDGVFTFTAEVETLIEAPEGYHLSPPYPNPFNPSTAFTLTVSQEQQVEVSVYDVLGQRVAVLHQGTLRAQEAHRFTFDAVTLPSGTYLIRAMGERFTTTRRVLLVK